MKNALRKFRSTRPGTLLLIVGALLLAALILINVLLAVLPKRYTAVRTGGSPVVSVSDVTKRFLDTIDEPVTIWRLTDYDAESTSLGISGDQLDIFLSRYMDRNQLISVVEVDMDEEPGFTAQYTTEALSDGSLIVESEKRSWVISADSMCQYNNDLLDQLFGQTTLLSESQLLQYMNYVASAYEGGQEYLEQSTTRGYFRGEALLTSALDYVTADVIPHGYCLTGHGSVTLPARLMQELTLMGVTELDLHGQAEVPADADCLILYAPTEDLSDAEYDAIRAYLAKGGSLLLATSYATVDTCPNVMNLGRDYGLSALPGQVRDSGSGHYAGSNSAYLIPDYNPAHILSYTVGYQSQIAAFMPFCHAIAVESTLPAGVSVSPLLYTSESGRRHSVETASAIGDPGKLNVAVCADRTVIAENGSEKTGHLIWFGSTEAFSEGMAAAGSYSGYSWFAYSAQYLSTGFTSGYSSIEPVDMSGSALTGLNSGSAIAWMIVLAVVLPLLFAAVGVLIWLRRRKRA